MKSLEFLKQIDKNLFVIWWSEAINKQVKWFRKSNDIDIMVYDWNLDFFEFKAKKMWLKFEENKNQYWELEINKIIFDDKSSIDIIVWKAKNIIHLDNNFYVKVEEVMEYKMDLLFNDIKKNLNNKNKHLIDLIFLQCKWFKLDYNRDINYYDLIENKVE